VYYNTHKQNIFDLLIWNYQKQTDWFQYEQKSIKSDIKKLYTDIEKQTEETERKSNDIDMFLLRNKEKIHG